MAAYVVSRRFPNKVCLARDFSQLFLFEIKPTLVSSNIGVWLGFLFLGFLFGFFCFYSG